MKHEKIYGVVGAGGYGREVIPIVHEMMNTLPDKQEHKIVFVIENVLETSIDGHDVMSVEDFVNSLYGCKYFNVAIADSKVRERLAEYLIDQGAIPFTITHPNSVIYESSIIHYGSILSPFTCVTADARIGKFFHANLYSYVAHDCVIGDYVTFAPGVKCNGNVVIEDHVYVGAGAIIKQGSSKKPLIIGAGAVIGMGAVVTKSVPPGVTVFGNPAKLLTKSGMKH